MAESNGFDQMTPKAIENAQRLYQEQQREGAILAEERRQNAIAAGQGTQIANQLNTLTTEKPIKKEESMLERLNVWLSGK
jgi:hypothetical protein